MEPSALLGVAMFRSSPWCLLCGCGRPFSSRAWYQLLQKQRGSRKPVTDNSSEVSILSPTRSLSPEEMLNLLEASVVHADGKPEELTLLSLLPDLSQKLGFPQNLDVIKAAVKESSGLVLLSGCPSTTQRLQDFYARCKRAGDPAATYCAVTTRIPAASEGEIRTCLKLIKVEDHKLVVPVASPSRGSLQRKEVRKTQTLYKVLDSREGCALVQLQPLTAFTNQLLVSLILLLSPALGDHVYSSRVGSVLGEPFLLPAESTLPRTQVLEDALLKKLCLQQQLAHRLPLHLHLHQLLLPAAGSPSSRTVLTAPPPPFFLKTLCLLGLALPQDKNKQ
ncbi:mitochondrial mRNA pseudouridine synthase RPUSD3 isoform X2 [Podarcis raffonei]|uniref:mitochondrial mRNA pseudouridine synthase RPUSD3 isoform X2 n=1 Tax=Podarcis raffonei TaxID=65483 RepID=UPI0023294A87|nr:mitochondrial mRNA pseudouridine synthase RPUSD3 isoform X2 [Podarcis raffonei]